MRSTRTLLQLRSDNGEDVTAVNIDELCATVNRRLRTERIKVESGRTAARVTPRNVRYYRTVGLISAPERDGGRAHYAESHVEEIVAIKRLQAEGRSLEEVRAMRNIAPERQAAVPGLDAPALFASVSLSRASDQSWSPVHMNRSMYVEDAMFTRPELGWSFRLGDVTLSGTGRPPTQEQLDSISQVLSGEHPE